jgi:hypothetical protein
MDMIKQHLFKSGTEQRCVPSSPTTIWTPPPPGMVLVNSDAAIFEASGCMGAGVVVRDHLGTCLVACRQHMVGVCLPKLVEALALRRAAELARDEGLEKVKGHRCRLEGGE